MWKEGNPCALLVRLQIGIPLIEKSMEIPQKNKNRYIIQPSNSTFGYLSKENENTNSKTYIYPYVHCSVIYNSQDIEAT